MDQLEASYLEIPRITRTWVTLVVGLSLACQLNLVSPFHIHFDWGLVWARREWWRLFASFFYFGSFGIDFIFHMFFLTRYSRLLEETSFRHRPADYVVLLAYAAVSILVIAALLPDAYPLHFLSGPLVFVLVYLWSRRNPLVQMNFLGVLNFTAPYLPWVLVGFAAVLHASVPVADLVGIAVGHVYWYCEDIYPRLVAARTGQTTSRLFAAPAWLARLCNNHASPPPRLGGGGDLGAMPMAEAAAPEPDPQPHEHNGDEQVADAVPDNPNNNIPPEQPIPPAQEDAPELRRRRILEAAEARVARG